MESLMSELKSFREETNNRFKRNDDQLSQLGSQLEKVGISPVDSLSQVG